MHVMPYERFEAWQACHILALEVYKASKTWPREEMYGLTSQVRRAATSALLNIAEGSAKRGPREFRRYLDNSLGSLSELACSLRLAKDLGFMSEADWERLDDLRWEAGRKTWGLYEAVQTSADRVRPSNG